MGDVLGCPRCGAAGLAGARFCSSCGAALGADPAGLRAPRAERKSVTIVFTDVTGFTALTERLDPERLRRVMTRYFDEMRTVVERHGGMVEKFIGDAIMAVFGLPRSHEDDALRAVRAALEMREALVRLNDDLERERGVTIRVRTGIDTGEVAVGAAEVDGTLILGDAVNVAARLQQAAAPQEILLGETTNRLVAASIDAERLDALSLKGKGEPVPTFRLIGLRPETSVGLRRLDTPMVGRREEHIELLSLLGVVRAERACHTVVIVGSAGVGKTRLVAEFVHSVEGDAEVVQGHCPSYGEGITFWPVTEVVKELAGIEGDHSLEEAQARLESLLHDDDDCDAIVEHVGQLLGLQQPTVASEQIFWAARKLLEKAAAHKPLVVVFEDAHWAEPTFLDFVEYVERHPGWGGGRSHVSRMPVEPLTPDESVNLIENLLHGETFERPGQARIVEATQGNPLYLEEMVSMFIDEGLIRCEDGHWVEAADVQDIPLPLTLQSLLVSRLDRLDRGEREVIEVGAVMGAIFSRRALLELVVDQSEAETHENLQRLMSRELLSADASGAWEDAIGFHHALIREAAYTCMSKEIRAEVHERFADWLARTQAQGRVGGYEEVSGYHLEHAYLLRQELRPLDDHGRALAARGGEQLSSAGRKALSRGDVVAAGNLLRRAAGLLPDDSSLRLSILPALSECLMMTGQVQQACDTLDEAWRVAENQGDRAVEAYVLLVRTTQRLFTQPTGWADAARAEVHRVIPVFEGLSDNDGLARSWRLLGLIEFVRGQCASAGEAVDRAGTYAHRAGNRREELESLAWLPLALFSGPLPAPDGMARCQQIIERADGDRKVEASARLVRGTLEAMSGDLGTARRSISTARQTFEDLGLRFWIAGAVAYLAGWVELLAGDAVAAERELRCGYEALRQMGDRSWLSSTVVGILAHSLYAQGRYPEAEDLVGSRDKTAGSDDVFSEVVGRGALAKVLCARGHAARAESVGLEALRLAAGTDCTQLHGESLMDLAEVYRCSGREADAVPLVTDALGLYTRKGNVLAVEKATATLGRLASSGLGS